MVPVQAIALVPSEAIALSGGGLYMLGAEEAPDAQPQQPPAADAADAGGLHGIPGADGFLVQVAGNTFERPGYTRAWPVGGPAPTQSTTPERALVTPPPEQDGLAVSQDAVIASYYGTGDCVRPAHEPAGTVTSVDRHALLTPAGGTRQRQAVDAGAAHSPTQLTRGGYAVTTRPRAEVDIMQWTFRMLVPKEAQALMDLAVRADGEIYKTIELNDTGTGVRITNSDGVRLSGNAVCQTQWANILHRVFCATEGREDPRSVALSA